MSSDFRETLREFVENYQRGRLALEILFWLLMFCGAVVVLFGLIGFVYSVKQGFIYILSGSIYMLSTYVIYCVFKAVLMMRDRMSLAAREKMKKQ